MKLCDSQIFQKNYFCPQNWENGVKVDQKKGFWNLLKNLVINFTEFVL